jgi:hypothetical protein
VKRSGGNVTDSRGILWSIKKVDARRYIIIVPYFNEQYFLIHSHNIWSFKIDDVKIQNSLFFTVIWPFSA